MISSFKELLQTEHLFFFFLSTKMCIKTKRIKMYQVKGKQKYMLKGIILADAL